MVRMGASIECGHVSAWVYYDDQDPKNKGWYASYSLVRGGESRVIDDSMKVWHPEMPRRRDARKKAERIARSHACRLDRRDEQRWKRR